ncbi:hypothetical protein ACT3TS_14065 [Specibacter sp. AOP5-B1-6]|uniref:hypothetical protein n=1 Tax=Specibacter sp. AOP5-B1-6 TaxID=3457653 RepID=UPI00402BEA14
MGHTLTRRWIAAAIAAVMLAALWSILLGGAAQAQPAHGVGDTAVVQTTQQVQPAPKPAPTVNQNVAQEGTVAAKKVAATPKAPKGSPLGVQLATIAVLVILGVGYFRLMSHSGRRAPAKKPAEEPAATAAAGNGKQPDGA